MRICYLCRRGLGLLFKSPVCGECVEIVSGKPWSGQFPTLRKLRTLPMEIKELDRKIEENIRAHGDIKIRLPGDN